jgi:hypothetical protein
MREARIGRGMLGIILYIYQALGARVGRKRHPGVAAWRIREGLSVM